MAEKHLVCQGAICKCKFGGAPDKLKVLTHKKEYINDPSGQQKLIVSTKDIGGSTFEKNTFGPCAKQKNKPCKIVVMEWLGFYPLMTLMHGGKVLLEDSKATCPIGGAGCIEIVFHGQSTHIAQQQMDQADKDVMSHLYPLGSLRNLGYDKLIPKSQ